MPKLIASILLFLLSTGRISPERSGKVVPSVPGCREWYAEMNLERWVDYAAFEQACEGYRKIPGKRKEILTLIDYTKPSTEERLVVLDMKRRKVLFSSCVSQGRNSGGNYAVSFSNENGSHKSSLGFFLTENTYRGKNGYSLVLEGLEKGINDRARERAIVIHGAPYSDPAVIAGGGRLGRSLGCPALPPKLAAPIIDAIRGGSLLYIYGNDRDYPHRSPVLSGNAV